MKWVWTIERAWISGSLTFNSLVCKGIEKPGFSQELMCRLTAFYCPLGDSEKHEWLWKTGWTIVREMPVSEWNEYYAWQWDKVNERGVSDELGNAYNGMGCSWWIDARTIMNTE